MKLFFVCFLSTFFFSCKDKVQFTYVDAVNNEIEYFFEDNNSLDFYHDIDKSVIHGHFTPEDINKYSASVDSACNKYKWTKIIDDADKKMYLKKENFHYSIVTIIFLDSKKVTIKMFSF